MRNCSHEYLHLSTISSLDTLVLPFSFYFNVLGAEFKLGLSRQFWDDDGNTFQFSTIWIDLITTHFCPDVLHPPAWLHRITARVSDTSIAGTLVREQRWSDKAVDEMEYWFEHHKACSGIAAGEVPFADRCTSIPHVYHAVLDGKNMIRAFSEVASYHTQVNLC